MQSSAAVQQGVTIRRQVLDVAPLVVDCTSSEIRPGEWLALGSVRLASEPAQAPASILVGQGRSHTEALAELEHEVEHARVNPARWGGRSHQL